MINVALVGCGRISPCHCDAVASNKDDFRIAAVCDVDRDRAKALAGRLGCEWTDDMRRLDGRGIDLTSVLTPSGLHPRHVCELAEKTDIPMILSEKPLALSTREAMEVYACVDRCGKRLVPVYQNRYNPIVMRLKELVDAGAFGRIHQFAVNVYWRRGADYYSIPWHGTKELDGGVLFTQASHFVDMIHHFLGPVRRWKGFNGTHRGLDIPDTVSLAMEFENGAVGTVNATVSVYGDDYMTELTLIGEKGTVRLDGINMNRIAFWNVEGVEKPDLDFTITHQYGLGHRKLYSFIAAGRWEMFPERDKLLSGIRVMESVGLGG